MYCIYNTTYTYAQSVQDIVYHRPNHVTKFTREYPSSQPAAFKVGLFGMWFPVIAGVLTLLDSF